MNKYIVLSDNKPASRQYSSWGKASPNGMFNTFGEAIQYANEWIGGISDTREFKLGESILYYHNTYGKNVSLVILKLNFNTVLNDLEKLPGFKFIGKYSNNGIYYGTCRNFNIIIFYSGNWDLIKVGFGIKKTFDRWANSRDFYLKSNFDPKHKIDLTSCYAFMMKVIKSGIFKHYNIDITSECKMIKK